jgi:hypothetical protein
MNHLADWQAPFEHPDADEAYDLFNSFNVTTEEDYARLSSNDRILYDVVRFEAEVMNGGIDQFFYNASGDHALETLAALEAIGATDSHRLLASACALFPGGAPSTDIGSRRTELESLRPDDGESNLNEVVAGDVEYDLYGLLFAFRRRTES